MPEVSCARVRIKAGSVPAVREWARVINARRDEALAALRDESVCIESVFLEHAPEADYLIYYLRATDLAASREITRHSTRAIESYHRQFMREHTEPGIKLEVLIDLESPIV